MCIRDRKRAKVVKGSPSILRLDTLIDLLTKRGLCSPIELAQLQIYHVIETSHNYNKVQLTLFGTQWTETMKWYMQWSLNYLKLGVKHLIAINRKLWCAIRHHEQFSLHCSSSIKLTYSSKSSQNSLYTMMAWTEHWQLRCSCLHLSSIAVLSTMKHCTGFLCAFIE